MRVRTEYGEADKDFECRMLRSAMGASESRLKKLVLYEDTEVFERKTIVWVRKQACDHPGEPFSVLDQLSWAQIEKLTCRGPGHKRVEAIYRRVYTFFHIYKERSRGSLN
jgi:hypothetical protein